jgi:hypothetical protein
LPPNSAAPVGPSSDRCASPPPNVESDTRTLLHRGPA